MIKRVPLSELVHVVAELPRSPTWWAIVRRRAEQWPERVNLPIKLKMENGKFRLVDGMHRLGMAHEQGDLTILAEVTD